MKVSGVESALTRKLMQLEGSFADLRKEVDMTRRLFDGGATHSIGGNTRQQKDCEPSDFDEMIDHLEALVSRLRAARSLARRGVPIQAKVIQHRSNDRAVQDDASVGGHMACARIC